MTDAVKNLLFQFAASLRRIACCGKVLIQFRNDVFGDGAELGFHTGAFFIEFFNLLLQRHTGGVVIGDFLRRKPETFFKVVDVFLNILHLLFKVVHLRILLSGVLFKVFDTLFKPRLAQLQLTEFGFQLGLPLCL